MSTSPLGFCIAFRTDGYVRGEYVLPRPWQNDPLLETPYIYRALLSRSESRCLEDNLTQLGRPAGVNENTWAVALAVALAGAVARAVY